MEIIETFEELREFNKECDEKRLNAFDTKNILKAEKHLNKNTKQIAFAFVAPKNWSKLKAWEKENVFRQIDGLEPLEEPVKARCEKAKSSRSKNYI